MTHAGPTADLDPVPDTDSSSDVDHEDTSEKRRSDAPPTPHACYRCGDSLDGGHWIRLATQHRGSHVDAFTNVTRAICPDCAAAVGLLTYAIESEG